MIKNVLYNFPVDTLTEIYMFILFLLFILIGIVIGIYVAFVIRIRILRYFKIRTCLDKIVTFVADLVDSIME